MKGREPNYRDISTQIATILYKHDSQAHRLLTPKASKKDFNTILDVGKLQEQDKTLFFRLALSKTMRRRHIDPSLTYKSTCHGVKTTTGIV
jgi:hypothetical protein